MTGSDPATAVKPAVPHPRFPPNVMLFRMVGFAYSVGMGKPTDVFPGLARCSVMSVMVLPKVGDEAEVA